MAIDWKWENVLIRETNGFCLASFFGQRKVEQWQRRHFKEYTYTGTRRVSWFKWDASCFFSELLESWTVNLWVKSHWVMPGFSILSPGSWQLTFPGRRCLWRGHGSSDFLWDWAGWAYGELIFVPENDKLCGRSPVVTLFVPSSSSLLQWQEWWLMIWGFKKRLRKAPGVSSQGFANILQTWAVLGGNSWRWFRMRWDEFWLWEI